MAIGTVIFLSCKKANKRGEKPWNATAKLILISMAVPLMVGELLIIATQLGRKGFNDHLNALEKPIKGLLISL